MNINLVNVGKRFNTEWIFSNITFKFQAPGRYAITGPNGSGKSTLLQVIGGYIQQNQGDINYQLRGKKVAAERIFRHVSVAAPYLELIEEMTLHEFMLFHQQMKGLQTDLSIRDMAEYVSLGHAIHKQIRYYSSGMKQRAKLAQAFFSPTPILLLDEPVTNLDAAGIDTYNRLIEQFTRERIVIISSNDEREIHFCEKRIHISDFKQNDNS